MRRKVEGRLRSVLGVGVVIVGVALSGAVRDTASAAITRLEAGSPVAATTALTPSTATGTYGGTTTLTATLTAGGNGVAGKTVEFALNGSDVGGATTDVNGLAQLTNVSLAGIGAGSYPTGVGASFVGDIDYDASSGSSSLTISKAGQAILISIHAPTDAAFGDHFTVGATGGASGNAVTYGSSGSCTNTGADYTMTGTAQCTVTYDQAGSTNYNAAPQLTETVNGKKADQTIQITTHAPASAVYGTGFTVAATGGGSGNAITYGSSGACTNAGAQFTMTSGTGTCTVTYDQAGNTNYNAATQETESVTAQKANQTINVTVAAPSTAAYNASFGVNANAPGGAVSFSSSGVCTNVGAHFTMTSGTGTCTVPFDRAPTANYNAAPQVSESVTATKADQTIHDHDRRAVECRLRDGLHGRGDRRRLGQRGHVRLVGRVHEHRRPFTMTSGTGTCTVTYDQAGDTNYNAAPQKTEAVTAQKADQTIDVTTSAPSSAAYNSSFDVDANAPGGAARSRVRASARTPGRISR